MNDADHVELLTVLRAYPGPVAVSGYDHPLYGDMLNDWDRQVIEAKDGAHNKRIEVLWRNGACFGHKQMELHFKD
jgi:hypothetical protein